MKCTNMLSKHSMSASLKTNSSKLLHQEREIVLQRTGEQVFWVKKTRGAAAPAWTTCCLQSQVRTRQHVKTMLPLTQSMSAHTDADCAYIFLSLSPSSFGSVQSNLASHAHYTAYPQCISVLQDINTIWKCSEMHTHRSQGHSSRCLVKTEENSFEHKQHSLLETVVTYISLHAKLSYAKQ